MKIQQNEVFYLKGVGPLRQSTQFPEAVCILDDFARFLAKSVIVFKTGLNQSSGFAKKSKAEHAVEFGSRNPRNPLT